MMPRSQSPMNYQLTLSRSDSDTSNGDGYLSETFRRLYYHLYTNSNTSRAERILGDLSMILLSKLVAEKNSFGKTELQRYRDFGGTADEILTPLLRSEFPGLIDTQQRFNLGDAPVRWALDEISELKLTSSPAHILGDAFQALIGPRLRGDRGQFFTPKSLVKAMVRVVDPKPCDDVLDPACGTGGFLAETYSYQLESTKPQYRSGHLVGMEKDHDLARLSAALLEITTAGRATVVHCNSLDSKEREVADNPKGVHLFDVILTNPPFGARIGIRDVNILEQFDLGHRWARTKNKTGWHQTDKLSSSQDPQLLFLELCVRQLKPGGRLGIVLPEGAFGNRRLGYVWHWIRTQGRVFALLDCPRTTFQPSTDTKTNVLFFEKSVGTPVGNKAGNEKVHVAVALHCGHDRRGRSMLSNGNPRPDDFRLLGEQFAKRENKGSDWHEVVLKDPDYIVPRYYVDHNSLSPEEGSVIEGAKIASIADLVRDQLLTIRKGHEPGSDAYGTGRIPFVRTSDISNLEISADPTNGVSEDIYARFASQQRLKPGDILMVVDGRYRIGMTALVTRNNYRCVVQSHFRILDTPSPDKLDTYELLFALNLPSVRMRIRNHVFVQSTLGTLGTRLLELRIPLLSGDGPWRTRVDRFRDIICQRDHLLSEINSVNTVDYVIES